VRADGDRLAVSIDERSEAMGGGDPAGSAGGAGGKAPRGIDQAGREGVRHWPAVPGIAMAERTSGGPAIGFLAMGDLFAEHGDGPHGGALCAYLNRGLLTIDTYVTDVRTSANVMTRVHLHLAEGGTV